MHAGVRGSGQFLALLQVVHSVEPWTLSLTSAPYLGKGRGDKYLCFGFFLAQVRSPAVECLYGRYTECSHYFIYQAENKF